MNTPLGTACGRRNAPPSTGAHTDGMERERRLTALLSGPFTAADAAACGIGSSVLRRWLKVGDIRRVLQGIYVGSHVPETPTIQARAWARLVPNAVICGRTAAWLWGVGAVGNLRGKPVEMIVRGSGWAPRRTGCVARTWALGEGDTAPVSGVTATTPLRTAADLARTTPGDEAVVILDAFLHQRLVTKSQLAAAVDRFAGQRGVRKLAATIERADGRSVGPEETLLRLDLEAVRGIPRPEPGWRVMSALGRPLHRFSLAWPGLRLGVDVEPVTVLAAATQPGAGLEKASIPAIRLRGRPIGGEYWRVVECGTGEVTTNRHLVMAQILHELRNPRGLRQVAA